MNGFHAKPTGLFISTGRTGVKCIFAKLIVWLPIRNLIPCPSEFGPSGVFWASWEQGCLEIRPAMAGVGRIVAPLAIGPRILARLPGGDCSVIAPCQAPPRLATSAQDECERDPFPTEASSSPTPQEVPRPPRSEGAGLSEIPGRAEGITADHACEDRARQVGGRRGRARGG